MVSMSKQIHEKAEDILAVTVDSLSEIRQETGQIAELTTEENMLVEEFFLALVKIMHPLTSTLPVSTSILPKEWGRVSQASIDLSGQLLVLYHDKIMTRVNLSEQSNRELLLEVTRDIMPTLKKLVTSYRQKIENRVKFLSSVTKELQTTAQAFSLDEVAQLTP